MRYFLFFCLLMSVTFYGCERNEPLKRTYTEIMIEPDAPPMAPKQRDSMPQDAIHAGLDMNNMPQDDIHAGFNMNNMPNDDIHAGFNSGNMPQDDVHANVSGGGGMNMAQMAMTPELENSVDRAPIAWTTPAGWGEKPGSGMRVVTFFSNDADSQTETSIISLGGNAGGLEANVTRWMRQVGINPQAAGDMASFLAMQDKVQTQSGLEAIVIDLAKLQQHQADDAPSMLAAIIDRGQSQIFVKMTGTKKAIRANKGAFQSLLLSIEDQASNE